MIVIAEKPRQAWAISRALGSPRRFLTGWKVGEVKVLPAAGHLFVLESSSPGYPVFEYAWRPHPEKMRYLRAFAPSDEEVVVACDYDHEGSLIGYNIARFSLGRTASELTRMRFSSLLPQELRRAFAHREAFDLSNALAGEARHEVDWLFGINLSRFLMDVGGRTLSAGRVQIPALNLVVEREKAREAFQPQVYFEVIAEAKAVEFKHLHRFSTKQEAQRHLPQRTGHITLSTWTEEVPPPLPYNLSDLQVDASKAFGFSPARTLKLAQSLYERALISYPRTDSRAYPKGLPHRALAEKLFALGFPRTEVRPPRQGKASGPHPAIYPTGRKPSGLSKQEFLLFSLICRRYLATLSPPAVLERQKAVLKAGEEFFAEGFRILSPAWFRYFPKEEKPLPFVEGETVSVKGKVRRKKTSPPPLFTRIGLVRQMEKLGLGTKATRGEIVEKILRRGYVRGSRMKPTPLGLKVLEVLKRHVPEITSPELTARLEKFIEQVAEGKRSKEEVVEFAKARVREVIKKLLEEKERIRQEMRELL